MPGLNWRPLPCQGSALPLRQPPEVETGFEPVYTDLQSVASPLGHSTGWSMSPSGRRDSNSRPSPWQGDALPTEPRPHALSLTSPSGCLVRRVENTSAGLRADASFTRQSAFKPHGTGLKHLRTSDGDSDVDGFQVLGDALGTALAPQPRVFDPAERAAIGSAPVSSQVNGDGV